MAVIPQKDFPAPGVAACELALAPESLEDYRTRIDANARRNGRDSGKLASNRVIKDPRGDRLETIWEFHPDAGGFWREVSVRIIANRQLYTFILNVEDSVYAKVSTRLRSDDHSDPVLTTQYRCRPALEAFEPLDPARIQVRPRPARGLEPRARAERGLRCSWPTDHPTASGPTTSWSWPMPIATSTLATWPRSFPTG